MKMYEKHYQHNVSHDNNFQKLHKGFHQQNQTNPNNHWNGTTLAGRCHFILLYKLLHFLLENEFHTAVL